MQTAFIMVGLCMAAFWAGYFTRHAMARFAANERRAESDRFVEYLNGVSDAAPRSRAASLRPAARWRRRGI